MLKAMVTERMREFNLRNIFSPLLFFFRIRVEINKFWMRCLLKALTVLEIYVPASGRTGRVFGIAHLEVAKQPHKSKADGHVSRETDSQIISHTFARQKQGG